MDVDNVGDELFRMKRELWRLKRTGDASMKRVCAALERIVDKLIARVGKLKGTA